MVTHWWLGNNGANWATVVCRSDATATVAITCDGNQYTGNADTSINDGVVSITVTGIDDVRRPYYVDGVYGGTLRAKRQTGPWWLASGSCWSSTRLDQIAQELLTKHDLDGLFLLGDLPYCNGAQTLYGETTVNVTASIANATNPANYLAHHRQVRLMPGLKDLMRHVPSYYMADDHEYPWDNARYPDRASPDGTGLTFWQTSPLEAQPTATQQNLDDAWDASRAAITAYATGLPTNTDAGIDSDALYCRDTIGPVEWFLTDSCGYGSVPTAPDDSSKTHLGAAQKAWLIDRISASSATFKLWVTPKQFWQGGSNNDTWAYASGAFPGYQTELKEILFDLRNVTGLLAVGGDQHRFTDQQAAAGDLGVGYPAISCLVGCPSSSDQNTVTYTGYADNIKYRDNAGNSAPGRLENVYALLKIEPEKISRYWYTSRRGLVSRGYIPAGSNQVQYQRARIG